MRAIHLLVLLLFVGLVSAGMAADKAANGHSYKAKLSGSEVVPEVKTKASGEATLTKGKETNAMTYQLHVKDLEKATAAHVHQGKKGENGPPVVTLFSGPKKETRFSGMLSEGTITAKDLAGPLKGKALKDLVTMIEAGNAYVNVHTEKFPDGELRGQLK